MRDYIRMSGTGGRLSRRSLVGIHAVNLCLAVVVAGCGDDGGGTGSSATVNASSTGGGTAEDTGGGPTDGSSGGTSVSGSEGTPTTGDGSTGSADSTGSTGDTAATGESAILFVTQVPAGGYGNVASAFFNHEPSIEGTPRGGALMLRAADGSLRNLTEEAGFGDVGMQGADAIAVREPTVHWDGDRAVFSMVVGAAAEKYMIDTYVWQIYEVSGLSGEAPVTIRKIEGQPNYNNVSPIYGSDDRILFASDRPRGGEAHLYPQRDEYESNSTVVGIYSLDEPTKTLTLLEHAPSGVFNLSVDSFGRVIFTRWDHLQRDQQGDAPATAATYEAFTYASEAADAAKSTEIAGSEVFPEARTDEDPTYDPDLNEHSFNQFYPWMIAQDGTSEETLNHIGRHEFGGTYTEGSFIGDANLSYYTPDDYHKNQHKLNSSAGTFQLREDPLVPGRFFSTYAQEFATAGAGVLLRFDGAPGINPEDMEITPVTPMSDQAKVPEETGYFRSPLPLSDGSLVAVHTPATGSIMNEGSLEAPQWNYAFRLRALEKSGDFYVPGAYLTDGIEVDISYFSPDVLIHYSGMLWELDPVEVRARPRPPMPVEPLKTPELSVFTDVGVSVEALRAWMRDHELALIVSRNVTQRDRADVQQPYNLRVPGGVESIAKDGTIYDITHLQLFQADLLRGYGPVDAPDPGRRVLARPMHGDKVSPASDGIPGAVPIAADGSVAAFVPARRAMTWQLHGPIGGVVRERNWVSFQAGEIRVCAACHGINTQSQTGDSEPTNPPEALRDLLKAWKLENPMP